jgi:hypothetical protein
MRGRKPKPWWDKNKKAWYVTVKGKRYRLGTERPLGSSDEGWIAQTVFEAEYGPSRVTLPPEYTATPEFVRSCMPTRGRNKLSRHRLARVAARLLELYGPDEGSLLDADVTDETDWEGDLILRGLAWDIESITRDLYDQDRQTTAELFPREFPERLPQLSPRSRGRRLGYKPGGVRCANRVKHPRLRYRDNGETATKDPPEKPEPKLLDPAPDSLRRQAYVTTQEKRSLLRRLDRVMKAGAERQRKIHAGLIQVTAGGDVPTIAFPRYRILSPTTSTHKGRRTL